jgi:hypothetical protein
MSLAIRTGGAAGDDAGDSIIAILLVSGMSVSSVVVMRFP